MSPQTIAALSLAVAALALLVSFYTWRVTHVRRQYEIADTILTDLLKITIQHPHFRDPKFIVEALTSDDAKMRYGYDAYATLVWNYLETLYDIYGEGLVDSPFYGALTTLGNRHKAWFFNDDRYHDYNSELPKFLKVSS